MSSAISTSIELMNSFRSELEPNRLELANLAQDGTQVKAEAEHPKRLNMTPIREQQLAGLLRDTAIT